MISYQSVVRIQTRTTCKVKNKPQTVGPVNTFNLTSLLFTHLEKGLRTLEKSEAPTLHTGPPLGPDACPPAHARVLTMNTKVE